MIGYKVNLTFTNSLYNVVRGSVGGIATGWMVRGYNPVVESGFLSFRTRPCPPWSPSSLIKWVSQLFLEVKLPGHVFGYSLLPIPQVTTSRRAFMAYFREKFTVFTNTERKKRIIMRINFLISWKTFVIEADYQTFFIISWIQCTFCPLHANYPIMVRCTLDSLLLPHVFRFPGYT
jgi:hypothetical protein